MPFYRPCFVIVFPLSLNFWKIVFLREWNYHLATLTADIWQNCYQLIIFLGKHNTPRELQHMENLLNQLQIPYPQHMTHTPTSLLEHHVRREGGGSPGRGLLSDTYGTIFHQSLANLQRVITNLCFPGQYLEGDDKL